MSRADQELLAVVLVFVMSLVLSGIITLIYRAARKRIPGSDADDLRPLPGGWVLGLMESYFYFAVLSIDGAQFLAAAWLAFKVASKWQSATWAKPTLNETRVGIRPFQVGTIGTLLIGLLGAAVLRG